MYRVSFFVTGFARALLGRAVLATTCVNLAPASIMTASSGGSWILILRRPVPDFKAD